MAVIADVIASRSHGDRGEVQRVVEETLAQAAEVVPPLEPFRATVGDELQAVFSSRQDALRATLYASLLVPDGPEMRFGLGEGRVGPVESATSEAIQDGPGWWNAREAVETLESRQRRFPALRSWFTGAEEAADTVVNAYLLSRDQIIAGLSVRARAYARGVLEGGSQGQIAAEHGVTQPAVSKLLRESGAHAVVEGFRMLS